MRHCPLHPIDGVPENRVTILNKEKILDTARDFIAEGKYDRAIREYEKLLVADPSDLRVKLRIAELYTKRKQITEAIRIYREVANAYAVEGFYLKAVTVHKNILRLNPSLTETNEQLASLYESMGLVQDAIRQYDILAAALEMKGQTDRVLEARLKLVRLAPRDGTARVKLAEIYQREGKIEEAIDQYEEYAKQMEASGSDKSGLADIFEKILAHRPDNHDMLKKLIGIYEGMGDHKKILKWLDSGKDVVEQDSSLLRLAAKIYSSQNQNETARAKFLALAELLKASGDVEGAIEAYCEILVLLPDEEDRISRYVEELRPGSFPEVAARARQIREEIEKEEGRRQDEEEKKKAAPPEAAAAKPPAEPKPAPHKAAPPAAPSTRPAAKQAAPSTKPAAKQAAPVEKPVVRTPDLQIAAAAFDLGMAYRRMGLADEAASELKKAADIYRSCLESGTKDEDISRRLSQIEEKPAAPPARRTEAQPEKLKEKESKKKVSFV
ncbi:MAG: tetratricopeptide repeat protein [Pseudomonadota bacterium]